LVKSPSHSLDVKTDIILCTQFYDKNILIINTIIRLDSLGDFYGVD